VNPFRRRRGSDGLRPTWEQRKAALERTKERLHREQRAETRRRAWAQVGLPLLGAAAFAAGLAFADRFAEESARSRPELFTVRRLEVEGARRLDAVSLARAVLPADAPDPITPGEVAARLEAHPWIASVAVARLAPDAVVARITEYEPAAVAMALGEPPLLVDAAGVAFAEAEGDAWSALPQLVVAEPPARGRRDPLLAQGVELARRVAEAGFEGIEIALDGEDPNAVPALRVTGVPARIVLGAGDPTPKLERLVRTLAGPVRGLALREIDLRFAEQVVLKPIDPEPGAIGADAKASGTGAGVGAPAPAAGARPGGRRAPGTDHRG
jgi:cell division septal protein FtsQ